MDESDLSALAEGAPVEVRRSEGAWVAAAFVASKMQRSEDGERSVLVSVRLADGTTCSVGLADAAGAAGRRRREAAAAPSQRRRGRQRRRRRRRRRRDAPAGDAAAPPAAEGAWTAGTRLR